ncbi:pesticin C-terminus-like muramidase [Limnobacter alexandrii]|uniref:pesticin C-terminus-like muramidase n=1 Tax=Limnobacter alexandrii TaxID=2570352 RepID=UPI0011084218|nr:pesticin C-terminus-like muramidase [Limnobacter alexandrii]
MSYEVDYAFLSKLEGGCRTGGYIPDLEKSKSGVTVATGFDLGARNEDDLRRLGIQGTLFKKLSPYLGLTRHDAAKKLEKVPLNISTTECLFIDQVVKTHYLVQLANRYNNAISSSAVKFEDLKPEFQTVITSVSFQYGLELARSAPKFWASVVGQDWKAAVKILRNFQDQYPTRRNKEADLMEGAL